MLRSNKTYRERLEMFRTNAALGAIALLIVGGRALAENDAHATSVGSLTIVHAWARAADAGEDTLVFLEIANAGEADRLTGAATLVAGSVLIVGLTNAVGEISTSPIGPVDVPPGAFELDPGGLALELRGLRQPLGIGTEVEMTLSFEKAGDVLVHVEIEARDAMQHSHAGHAH
ncbi:MAG: copper chaperone PCu(A)C [Rhizobiaceae bacterium]|nr:copper chaperone PCu(A)C [Rhizobiaceae bacterium]